MALAPEPNIIIVPATNLPAQPWWKALHLTINTSFQNKDGIQAYPPTWTRLPSNPREAAERLRDELGPDGIIAVVLLVDRPIACAGALPFRGVNWINGEKSAGGNNGALQTIDGHLNAPENLEGREHAEQAAPAAMESDGGFEICCMCIHPLHRRIGLSYQVLQVLENALRRRGAKRLYANFAIEETGRYWPKMGFETIPNAGGVLKKGFTHTHGMEALREDLHFAMGIKDL